MSKHNEKPIKISITLPRKYAERILITVLLLSHLVSFDVGSWGLNEHQAKPRRCAIDAPPTDVYSVKTVYVDSG